MDFAPSSLPDLPSPPTPALDPLTLEEAAKRISLLDGSVVLWRETTSLTTPSLEAKFQTLAERVRSQESFGWVWDVAALSPPTPAALLHFRTYAAAFAPRTTHLAVRTGVNVGLWLALRHVLPGAGFSSISVHRGLTTAQARARRG